MIMQLLEFTFRDFWTFWGVYILLLLICETIANIVAHIVLIFRPELDNDYLKNKEEEKENESSTRTDIVDEE